MPRFPSAGSSIAITLVVVIATVTLTFTLLTATSASAGDWPQWRGPGRNGVAADGPALASSWSDGGPAKLWESEELPHKGGWGSVAVAGGRAYLFVNWHAFEAIATRRLDGRVFGKLHWFDRAEMSPALVEKMERARGSRPPELRGRKLNDWIESWIAENLDGAENEKWRGVVSRRLKLGAEAVPLEAFSKLETARDREFPSEAALTGWLVEQEFSEAVRERILRSVETQREIASDVVLCLDVATGQTVWKRQLPGRPRGNDGSSTPCVDGGRLYFAGTTHVHCLDAATGAVVWSGEPERGGTPSSIVLTEKLAVVLAGELVAFDRESGAVAWSQKDVRGRRSSPVLWRGGDREYVICNADSRKVACVDAETGELAWTAAGGGIASAVVVGDHLVVHSQDEAVGLTAYRLTPTAAERLWSHPRKSRGAATPIVQRGRVYLIGGNVAMGVELDSGEIAWQKEIQAEISSPVLADGKLLGLMNRGGTLVLLDASTEGYRELARARVRAAWCPSPALADGRLFLRHKDRVVCYDLRE